MVAALNIHHLTVAYRSTIILHNICAEIPQGVIAALIGPNGAGKTTLLKSILAMVPTVAGSVTFMGKSYDEMKLKIGYVPQRSSVDWDFPATCRDVVIMGRYGHLGWFKRPTRTDWDIANNALESVGLTEYAHRSINELSGGQQQRLFLARALAQEADLYFLDEPFAGIDAQSEQLIMSLLKKLRHEGKTIIIVHHDLRTLTSYFDWALLINRRVIACGPIEQTITPTLLAQTYGSPL